MGETLDLCFLWNVHWEQIYWLNIWNHSICEKPQTRKFQKSIHFSAKLVANDIIIDQRSQPFHDESRYHIETSPLICSSNQWTGILCKSIDWFLYDNGLRHERVKYGKTLHRRAIITLYHYYSHLVLVSVKYKQQHLTYWVMSKQAILQCKQNLPTHHFH